MTEFNQQHCLDKNISIPDLHSPPSQYYSPLTLPEYLPFFHQPQGLPFSNLPHQTSKPSHMPSPCPSPPRHTSPPISKPLPPCLLSRFIPKIALPLPSRSLSKPRLPASLSISLSPHPLLLSYPLVLPQSLYVPLSHCPSTTKPGRKRRERAIFIRLSSKPISKTVNVAFFSIPREFQNGYLKMFQPCICAACYRHGIPCFLAFPVKRAVYGSRSPRYQPSRQESSSQRKS